MSVVSNHSRRMPRSIQIKWTLITTSVLAVIYHYVLKLLPKLQYLSYPQNNVDSWVSVSILIAIWLQSVNTVITNGLISTFWRECIHTLAIICILFVAVRLAIMAKTTSFNPATAWWSFLVAPPVGPALGIAILNSFLVSGIVKGVYMCLTTNKQRSRYEPAVKPLLLVVHVTTLVLTFLGLLIAFPRKK